MNPPHHFFQLLCLYHSLSSSLFSSWSFFFSLSLSISLFPLLPFYSVPFSFCVLFFYRCNLFHDAVVRQLPNKYRKFLADCLSWAPSKRSSTLMAMYSLHWWLLQLSANICTSSGIACNDALIHFQSNSTDTYFSFDNCWQFLDRLTHNSLSLVSEQTNFPIFWLHRHAPSPHPTLF